MARNNIATIGAGTADGKIDPCSGSMPSGQTISGAGRHVLMRRPLHIRIDDRAKPLALAQGSGFRRAVDIEAGDLVADCFFGEPRPGRSLIALSKQLVG